MITCFFYNIDPDKTIKELVGNYISEIEKLKAKLIESEQMKQQMKKYTPTKTSSKTSFSFIDGNYTKLNLL